MIRRSGLLLVCAVLLAAPAAASESKTHAQLQKIQTQLDQKKARAAELDKQAAVAGANIKDLRQKLIRATAVLQAKEEDSAALADRLHDIEKEIADRSQIFGAKKQKLAALTMALIELSRKPPAVFILQTGLTFDHIHRAELLRALLPRLHEETEAAAADLVELNKLHMQAAAERRLLQASKQNLAWQQDNLDQLIKTRQGRLRRTAAEKAAIARQLVSLTSEAKDLRELLDKVSPRHGGTTLPANPALKWPVSGTVMRRFGTRDADGVISQGLTFRGLPGSPVVAPQAGRVVFAGPFRSYGKILILQHKGGYHSFLAGFGRIDAEMGQDVAKGEPLGTLPSGGDHRPELYFEWRRNGEPVDPMAGRKSP